MSQLDYNAAANTYTRCFEGKLTSPLCAGLSPAVEAEVKAILADKPDAKLVFDLAQVEYVVSAFLRICLWSAKQLPKGNFAITNCRPEVKKIFSIARFDNLFDVF